MQTLLTEIHGYQVLCCKEECPHRQADATHGTGHSLEQAVRELVEECQPKSQSRLGRDLQWSIERCVFFKEDVLDVMAAYLSGDLNSFI